MSRILLPTEHAIAEAAEAIKRGELVAFPTETVYGLGANALNEGAVARIFAAKGRPPSNPVIVHVGRNMDLSQYGKIPDFAHAIINEFWPGPLTLVVQKSDAVPAVVTAGGDTVGLRMPAHPISLKLLDAAGVPIAAPSANKSEQLSPSRAHHVAESLGDSVDIILDGGQSNVGIESTVLDVTVFPPVILRPGMVTAAMIARCLGVTQVDRAGESNEQVSRSPGQMLRHYAPRTRVVLSDEPVKLALSYATAAVVSHRSHRSNASVTVSYQQMSADPFEYAQNIYRVLHELDALGAEVIIVETIPNGCEWDGIRDRLRRAASTRDQSQ